MKTPIPFNRLLLLLAVPLIALSTTACGRKTEMKKTTIIERQADAPPRDPTDK
jgi:hypothetical protein